ncbi:hypothetical protein [Bdellovibrio sp. BCCA]|uniref:hypothetical protein n=1 Tax=Bdellovibrio sp. BCCA TaxID=3136281 RepID=UPI0030F11EFB
MVVGKCTDLKKGEYYYVAGNGVCLYNGTVSQGHRMMFAFIAVSTKVTFALEYENVERDAIVSELPNREQINAFFEVLNFSSPPNLSLAPFERYQMVSKALLTSDITTAARPMVVLLDFIEAVGIENIDKTDKRLFEQLGEHCYNLIALSKHATRDQVERAQRFMGKNTAAA